MIQNSTNQKQSKTSNSVDWWKIAGSFMIPFLTIGGLTGIAFFQKGVDGVERWQHITGPLTNSRLAEISLMPIMIGLLAGTVAGLLGIGAYFLVTKISSSQPS